MKMKYILFTLSIVLLAQASWSQMTQKSIPGPFLLKNAEIYTVSKGVLQGDILIEGEKISKIGPNLSSEKAQVIDCSGKRVYPGFIDGGTYLGLVEVSSISLTQDNNELGDFIPNMKALTAVNPNSVNIPVTRTNGVTTVLTMPRGGGFPGQAALIDLHGYTPQQMYAGFEAVRMNFPSSGKRGWWDRRSEEEIKKDEEKAFNKLNDIWDKAITYAKMDSLAKARGQSFDRYNPEMDALLPAVRKEANLLVEVNKKGDILNAIKWLKKRGIKAILTGCSEGWRVTDSLVQAGFPIITGPITSQASRPYDRYDTPYRNAARMIDAGLKVAIRTMETENVRNLPFNAGFAAAYGLGTERALRAITLSSAEIFGVDHLYGSIDEGKMANLFIADGDPFEMKTTISHLFIGGYQVPIENRHTLLYDEFLERDPGLNK
jgi:imidazolonepropionase-like amidohydrolase